MAASIAVATALTAVALLALLARSVDSRAGIARGVVYLLPAVILAFGYAAGHGLTLLWAVLSAVAAAVGLLAGSLARGSGHGGSALAAAGSSLAAAAVGAVGVLFAAGLITAFSGLNPIACAAALTLAGFAIALGARAARSLGRIVFGLAIAGVIAMLAVAIALGSPGSLISPQVTIPSLSVVPAVGYLIGIVLIAVVYAAAPSRPDASADRRSRAIAAVVAPLIGLAAVAGMLMLAGGGLELPSMVLNLVPVVLPVGASAAIAAAAAIGGALFAGNAIRAGQSGIAQAFPNAAARHGSRVVLLAATAVGLFLITALAPEPGILVAILGVIALSALAAAHRSRGASNDAPVLADQTLPRFSALVALIAGVAAATVLAATSISTVASEVGWPQGNLDSPALETLGVDKTTDFYKAQPVAKGSLPGTLRRVETVLGAPAGIRVQRFVYVSETAAGAMQEVSALYAVKDTIAPQPNGRPLITVAHGTSGVAPGCGISQEPFREGSNGYFWWHFYTLPLVNSGYAVVMSDYGNLAVPGVSNYIVMKGAAADVLNAARAAVILAPRDIDASNMAIIGHSQGGYNALSAAYLWPEYAPELPIKGVVAQAPGLYPPAPITQTLIQSGPGGTDLAGAAFNAHLADTIVSWSENFPGQITPSDVYTERGMAGYEAAKTTCILETINPLDGTYTDMVKQPVTANLAQLMNENMPVHHKYDTPILMQQGMKDTVVVPQANVAAAKTFCGQGSTVELQTYPADVHSSVMKSGWPNVLDWLTGRFAGERAPSNCN